MTKEAPVIDYAFALKRPFTDLRKFFIGAVMDAVPVVNIISYGFILECAGVDKKRRVSRKLPEFRSVVRFFAKDILASFVTFIYSLVAMIPYIWILMDWFHDTGGIQLGFYDITILELLLPVSTFVLMIVLPILLYPVPMVILTYAKHSKFGTAFRFRDVLSKAFTWDYFTAWIAMIAGAVVVQIIAVVPVLVGGWLNQPFTALVVAYLISGVAGFYTNIFSYTVYGQVFKKLEQSG